VIALSFLPAQSLTQLRRALPQPHQVRVAGTWEELTRAVAESSCDVVVVDPCVGAERSARERVRQLAAARACAPCTPVVGYVCVTAAAIHAVHSLVSSCGAEIVVRGLDDQTDALFRTLQRAIAGSAAEPLVLAIGDPCTPLPLDVTDALTLLFRRPDKVRSVDELAVAANTTRRTLDRWLARAGLAPARTLLACARVNAAFHLLTSGGVRAARVAALLGYASPRALARELQWLTGFSPSSIPPHVTRTGFVEALRPRLFRDYVAAASSY
jgi:AraC-like DNA-binding protein